MSFKMDAFMANMNHKQFMDLLKPTSFEEISEKFMSALLQNSEKEEALKRKFDGKRSFEEIFASIWELEEAHDMLFTKLCPYEKSLMLATMLRNEGNDYFTSGNYCKALERYNGSIQMSPHPEVPEAEVCLDDRNTLIDYKSHPHVKLEKYLSDPNETNFSCLAKGYANRSAVMIELLCYKKCLRDIDLALKYGYPKDLQPKLLARKERCLEALKQIDMERFVKKIYARKLPLLKGQIYANSLVDLQQILYFPSKKCPVLEDPHSSIPVLSSAVKTSFTPSKGRGLIADRNIKTGEILAIEEAYCVTLDLGRLMSYCNYCATVCLDPYPCPGCGMVFFCSLSCRSKAITGDHWLECKILPTLIALAITPTITAVKMLRQYSFAQMKNLYAELPEDKKNFRPEEHIGLNSKGIYTSNSYRPIHYMCSHKEKLSFLELFKYCQMAFILTKLVHESQRYFVDESGLPVVPTKADFVLTGSILLSNLIRMEYNVLRMADVHQRQNDVGRGLFPALSLINHSCFPSAMQYQIGRTMVVRALKAIHAGDEITITYNMTFQDEELPSRKRTLKKYLFTCDCIACRHYWPVIHVLPQAINKCPKCRMPIKIVDNTCHKCKVNYNSNSYRGNKKALIETLHSNDVELLFELTNAQNVKRRCRLFEPVTEEELEELWKAVDLFHKYLVMPCKVFCTIERIVGHCFDSGIFQSFSND